MKYIKIYYVCAYVGKYAKSVSHLAIANSEKDFMKEVKKKHKRQNVFYSNVVQYRFANYTCIFMKGIELIYLNKRKRKCKDSKS